MANLVDKSFDAPDEKRTPAKTTVDVVDLGDGVKAARFTMEPGWRWSECVKPSATPTPGAAAVPVQAVVRFTG